MGPVRREIIVPLRFSVHIGRPRREPERASYPRREMRTIRSTRRMPKQNTNTIETVGQVTPPRFHLDGARVKCTATCRRQWRPGGQSGRVFARSLETVSNADGRTRWTYARGQRTSFARIKQWRGVGVIAAAK